ncbi:MAG TPA: acyl-CoA thioesterase [Gemmatimonadales bacterium]|nr:acyl-CoA thioesterase [Gemmatimonadales bacterium]
MARPASVTLRFLAEPTHVNFGGKVHGGAVMKWIDQAGYTCAASWTGEYCVTAYVGGIRFLQPISVGELVEVRAQLIRTGRTSMDVAIDIYAGSPRQTTRRRACHCVMTFVAVDQQGEPKPVPVWSPSTPVERALEAHAVRLNEIRKTIDAEIETQLRWLDQQPPAEIDRG